MDLREIPFIIHGKDPRDEYLASRLQEGGYRAARWEKDVDPAAEAVGLSDEPVVLVLDLNAPDEVLGRLLERLPIGSACFGGHAYFARLQQSYSRGITYFDLLDDEAFCIDNAIPTAEGTLAEAMSRTNRTIHGMRVAVLGYGRVGKAMARIFKACAADVTVISREITELAAARASGLKTSNLSGLPRVMETAELTINTIPARLLDVLAFVAAREGALVIDVASGRNLIDVAAAKRRGITVVNAGSLPGKVAPDSAAEYLMEAIINQLKGWGGFETE